MSKEINPTAIRRVSFYTASPVECCDRCSQGIKHVALVQLKDGTAFKYGMDCINKILEGDTSLKGLFAKNQRLVKKYESYLRTLNLPYEEMPVDSRGYYDRGFYFVAGDDGKSIGFDGRSLFHPTKVDWDKVDSMMARGGHCETLDMRPYDSCWAQFTPENWAILRHNEIEQGKAWLEMEIERLSGFLGRILAKGLVTPENASSI